jgi:hypothetical protein
MKGNAIGGATGDYLSSLANLYGGVNQAAIGAGIGYGSQYADQRLAAANGLIDSAYSGTGLNANMAQQLFGMGGALTDLSQAGIDREVNRDMFNRTAPRESILFRQGLAGRMGDYGGTTITKTPTASPFQQALGAGLGLAGAYFTGGGSLGGMMGGMRKWFGGGSSGSGIPGTGITTGNYGWP